MNRYYTHFFYLDFLKGFKYYINLLTNDTINNFEFNTASKAALQKKIFENKGIFEHPNCYITMDDIQPVSSKHIMRDKFAPNEELNNIIGDNLTLDEVITVINKEVIISTNVSLTFDDSLIMLSYYDNLISSNPINFTLNPYSFKSYLNIDPLVQHWDFDNHQIQNVVNTAFEQSTQLYGIFATATYNPYIRLNSVNKTEDKDSSIFTIELSFSTNISVPQKIYLTRQSSVINHIEVHLSLNEKHESLPILIDLDDQIIQNQNIVNKNYDILLTYDKLDFVNNKIIIPDGLDVSKLTKFMFYYVADMTKASQDTVFITVRDNANFSVTQQVGFIEISLLNPDLIQLFQTILTKTSSDYFTKIIFFN